MSHVSTLGYLCRSRNVQAYFDDEQDGGLALLVEKHIIECAVCAAELRGLQRLRELIGQALLGSGEQLRSVS
jgi:hypothetical protein